MTEVASEESEDEEMKEVASEGSEKAKEIKDETSYGIKERERKDEEKDGEDASYPQVSEVELEDNDHTCEDEEINEVACKASERGEEIIYVNKIPDSQMPEVEESENATVKLNETNSEVTKSQLANIEPFESACDTEMGEADVQLTQSAPVLQKNSPTSQTVCASHSGGFTDKDLILNPDTSACKESDSIRDPGTNFGTGPRKRR
ncbi:uncharacterized protein PF11_0207-like [Stegodyphus dumicola]|uniref:uncharacterized protein PF11_0207-like n=1 Tax=Stegodyphus dumicola TaxID=202533 RepID=UPI0015AADD5D|nr:uncharacterized protein PF11_0207-like [Stegodyphus dumicola]